MKQSVERARALRGAQTEAETRLWYRLRAGRLAGWKFRRQYPVEGYIADFVCMAGRLIVEVDGGTHSTRSEIRYDEARATRLRAVGFQVLRVTNTDIYANLDGVVLAILAELATCFSPPPEGEVDGEAGGRGFTPSPEKP